MAKEFAKEFYASDKWKRVRLGYIAHRRSIDGGMCEECKEQIGYIVHHKVHITPLNINNPDITLSENNLEYVCQDCHNKIHKKKDATRTVKFDKYGNPIGF